MIFKHRQLAFNQRIELLINTLNFLTSHGHHLQLTIDKQPSLVHNLWNELLSLISNNFFPRRSHIRLNLVVIEHLHILAQKHAKVASSHTHALDWFILDHW